MRLMLKGSLWPALHAVGSGYIARIKILHVWRLFHLASFCICPPMLLRMQAD